MIDMAGFFFKENIFVSFSSLSRQALNNIWMPTNMRGETFFYIIIFHVLTVEGGGYFLYLFFPHAENEGVGIFLHDLGDLSISPLPAQYLYP